MPLYQDENVGLSKADRTVQPPDLLARSGLPVPEWRKEHVPQFNADFRRLVARISSLFALIAPTAQGAPESAESLALVAHSPQHQAGGGDEIDIQQLTAFGLTTGQVLRATGASAYAFQAIQVPDLPLAIRTQTITFVGQDVPSLSTMDIYTRVPFDCTVTRWSVFADALGSVQLDIWRSTLGTFPPSVAGSLVGGGNKPALVASRADSQAPVGWASVSLTAGDVVAIHHDSSAGVNQVSVVLDVLVS